MGPPVEGRQRCRGECRQGVEVCFWSADLWEHFLVSGLSYHCIIQTLLALN